MTSLGQITLALVLWMIFLFAFLSFLQARQHLHSCWKSSGNHPGWVYIIFMSLLPLFYVQTFSKWIFLSELIKKHISFEFLLPLYKQGNVVVVFILCLNWINDVFRTLIWINLDYFRHTAAQYRGNKGLPTYPAHSLIYIR